MGSNRYGMLWLPAVIAAAAGAAVSRAQNVPPTDPQWERFVGGLRAAGEPVTLADIERARPVIPPQRNGALIVERLTDRFERLGRANDTNVLYFDDALGRVYVFAGIPKVAVAPSRAFLEAHRGLVDELAPLREFVGGRFSASYDNNTGNPLKIALPTVAPWRTASKLLRLEAAVGLLDAQPERAVKAFRLQARLAATLGSEPGLVPRLVQISVDNLAVDMLEAILRLSEPDDQAITELLDTVDERLTQNSLKASFQLERVAFMAICDMLMDGRLSWGDFSPRPTPPLETMMSNRLEGAKMYTRLVDVADDPVALLRTVQDIDSGKTASESPTNEIVGILAPSFNRAVVLQNTCLARLRSARVALVAERFRRAVGRFPATLGELTPDHLQSIPLDPFDGRPLRLARSESGIVVYSVGENLADDGGDVIAPQESRFGVDVGFRLSASRDLILRDATEGSTRD